MLIGTILAFIFACAASIFSAVIIIQNQAGAVPVVFLPVLVAFFPMMLTDTRIARYITAASAIALLAFSIVAGFSIGLFYFPAAVVMLIAVFLPRKPAPVDALPSAMSEKEFWDQR